MNPDINEIYFVIDENSSLLETVAKILDKNPSSIIAEFNDRFLVLNCLTIRYDCKKKIDKDTTLKNNVGKGVLNVDIDVRDKDHNPVRQGTALATPTPTPTPVSAKASEPMRVDSSRSDMRDHINYMEKHIKNLENELRNSRAKIAVLTRNSTRNPTTVHAPDVGLMASLQFPIVRERDSMVRDPAPGVSGPMREKISGHRFNPY